MSKTEDAFLARLVLNDDEAMIGRCHKLLDEAGIPESNLEGRIAYLCKRYEKLLAIEAEITSRSN